MYRRMNNVSFRLEELGLTHEKNYFMMLRRLTNDRNIAPLKTLVDVIEPVKIYKRNQLRKHYSHSPLTRVVDAARPDAAVAREFRNTVNMYLKTKSDVILYNKLRNWLVQWQNNHSELMVLIKNSPVLNEIQSLSKDLANIAELGLTALNYIKEDERPGDDTWKISANKIIEDAKEPRGQAELMIIPGIEVLVKQISGETGE